MLVITQEGIYRHKVHGPYPTFEDAKLAAQHAREAERDSWHDWAVVDIHAFGAEEEVELGRWAWNYETKQNIWTE